MAKRTFGFKKVIATLLALVMCLGALSITAFAEESSAACKIGEVEYETLSAAVAAANELDAATIELLKDIVFEGTKLSIKKNITISGGFTISRGAYVGTMFEVANGATLTLDGGLVIDGSNNWSFDSSYYSDMAAYLTLSTGAKSSYTASAEGGTVATAQMISILSGGAAVMNSVTIQNNYATNHNNGALFKVPSGASLTVNGGALIQHIHCSVVGQISGSWTMNGGKIADVYAHNTNGGLSDQRGGYVGIYGGEITNVRTLGLNKNGNGILFQVFGESSKLNIGGGWIHDNASFSPGNGWGSVVYLNDGGDFTMTGGTIENTKTDICSAFVANDYTSVELLGGTIVVDDDTHPTYFESLFCGDTVIGENMNIVGKSGARFLMLGNANNPLEINGKVSGEGTMWLMHSEPVTGTGTVTSNVLIKTHGYYSAADVTLTGANWNCLITVDSVGSGASLTVKPGANVTDGLVRVLGSVASGDYTNAEESAAEQADAYIEEAGANVTSPVLYYHRLTAEQKSNIVVTFDYNGGLDAQNWSGCQITGAETFTPDCPQPTKEGMVLAGWVYANNNDPESLSMAGEVAYAGEEIAQSVRLIAQWEAPEDETENETDTDNEGDDLVDIPENQTPGANAPAEDNKQEEPKQEEPKQEEPKQDELVDIPDEQPPLADVPKTGDLMGLWMILSAALMGGMALLGKKKF